MADHVAVTAVATAPAEFADQDTIYNDKTDGYADNAFGWAAADGTSTVTLTGRVVDRYGTPITTNVANMPVTWSIQKFDYVNAILPTGHTYETTTNAEGVTTVVVEVLFSDDEHPERSGLGYQLVHSGRRGAHAHHDWRELGQPLWRVARLGGAGFTYFHGAQLTAELQKTQEGADKNLALADGADSVSYTATVMDSAFFNTPIPNWDVKFTTSLGSFDASGSKSAMASTNASGQATVIVKSPVAGTAYLRVYDRLGRTDSSPFWQNSVTKAVTFTDYKVVSEVLDATKRAGDRATALVRASFENIKTGQKVSWNEGSADFSTPDVYGYCADCHAGVAGVTMTNEADEVADVDTNADGKMDAFVYSIPAYDDEGQHAGRMESAGRRYALVQGDFSSTSWVNKVFYNMHVVLRCRRSSRGELRQGGHPQGRRQHVEHHVLPVRQRLHAGYEDA